MPGDKADENVRFIEETLDLKGIYVSLIMSLLILITKEIRKQTRLKMKII